MNTAVARCLAIVFLGTTVGVAERPPSFTEPLWAGGAPGSVGVDTGDVPELIFTIAESGEPTAAVVIFPGGGYHGHAMDHEGYQFAEWFNSLGVTSAICTYRLRGKGNEGN